jgi:hypothetical protein
MKEKFSTADFVRSGEMNTGAAVMDEPPAVPAPADQVPIVTPAPDNGAIRVTPPAPAAHDPNPGALFPDKECHDFRTRWDEIQIRFVDDPRKAAEDADSLVAEVMKRLAEIFAAERSNMETQWSRGENVSTEDLRIAVQRYRSFFNRLLLI